MRFTRYAVFYTPPDGAFRRFGAGWLGWDPQTGSDVVTPDVPGLPLPVPEVTETPKRYGLHATIKPPFRLAAGQTEAVLLQALKQFCRGRAPVNLDGLELAQLGRFLALVPEGDAQGVMDLAADAVRALDSYRAPMDAAERDRRSTPSLSPAQRAMLEQWGYPYVMEAFRFHITLSGKLPKAQASAVREVLKPYLEPLLPRPFCLDALSLMGEDPAGRFHLIERVSLSG